MSAYESGVGPRGAARFAANIADLGSRKLRNPADMIGRAHVADTGRARGPGQFRQSVVTLLRLVLPVMLLLTVGAACLIYSDVPVEGLGSFAGKPLNLGLVLLPATFFVIHLTNRRYGAAYACAQIALAWLLGLGALPWLLPMISPEPDARTIMGFGLGLFLSQFIAVVLFDGLRGPSWWKAPFFASLAGGVVLSAIGFPIAFAGTPFNWSADMVSYMELVAVAAVLLLIPYGLLRSLVPPSPGFGGY